MNPRRILICQGMDWISDHSFAIDFNIGPDK